MKEKILARDKKLYPSYEDATYYSQSVYYEVLKNKNLKYSWCYGKIAENKERKGLDLEYLISLCPDTDPSSHEWLDYGTGKNKITDDPKHRPSIDKIEPHKGYVHGNVQILSMHSNTIKNSASKQEFKSILENVKWEMDK